VGAVLPGAPVQPRRGSRRGERPLREVLHRRRPQRAEPALDGVHLVQPAEQIFLIVKFKPCEEKI